MPFSKILQLLNRYQAIERAQERAKTFTEKAREIIAGFPESEFQRALVSVTNLVTNRDH